jgi:type IX secretion system substrate protein
MRKYLLLFAIVTAIYFSGFTQTSSQTRTATLFNNLNEAYQNLWSQAGPQYFSADDNSYAYSKTLSKMRWPLLLVLRGFGFTIPTGATIENITVTVRRFKKGRGNVTDYFATLLSKGDLAGDLNDYGVRWTDPTYYPTIESPFTYTESGNGSNGGPSHDQTYQWTPEMINDPEFGVWIYNLQPVGGSVVIYYDYVQLTIEYSQPPVAEKSPATFEVKPLKAPIVYPNPFTTRANIQFTATETGKTAVELFDVSGAKVRTLFFGGVVRGQVYTVTVGDASLPKGTYVYLISNGNRKQRGQMIKLQ